ncbi:MAG: hypothetical protein ACREVG_02250 [Burkholderiales bacterium]
MSAADLKKGGSAGSPKGGSLSEKFRATITPEDQAAIIEAVVKAAKDGDMRAAETVLERVFPKPRPLAEVVRIPRMREAKTLVEKAAAVLDAVADGEITPEAGQAVLNTLARTAEVLETNELAQRLADLESQLHGKPARLTGMRVLSPPAGSDDDLA